MLDLIYVVFPSFICFQQNRCSFYCWFFPSFSKFCSSNWQCFHFLCSKHNVFNKKNVFFFYGWTNNYVYGYKLNFIRFARPKCDYFSFIISFSYTVKHIHNHILIRLCSWLFVHIISIFSFFFFHRKGKISLFCPFSHTISVQEDLNVIHTHWRKMLTMLL